jgi:flagellar motor protein MotB
VRDQRLLVSIPADLLFEGGREALRKEGKGALTAIAAAIKGDPLLATRSYEVGVHADASKRAGVYRETLAQTVARAREALTFLANDKGGGVSAERWSAAGYADGVPLAPNDTDDNRKKNRRCEITLQPSADERLDLRALAP